MGRILTALLIMSLLVTAGSPSIGWCAGKNERSNQLSTQGARKPLQTIVFAGVAGAILGLSTLSFYGRPQDKLNNIAVGAAIGIIGGTIYTTFKAATDPHEFYGQLDERENEAWRLADLSGRESRSLGPEPRLRFNFSF